MKKYNFSAGPAILPKSVFEEAAQAVVDFNSSGLSILEISHRSAAFEEVMDESILLVKELLDIPSHYEPLFLQGGASGQFAMMPMNLLGVDQTAGYIETGTWAKKAIDDAKLYGNVSVLASSKDDNYAHIPKSYEIPDSLRYLHITSNNTVCGTQYHKLPETKVKLVADMSSDIFSKPINISRFGLIYAGAQKNMGPAGATLVVLDKEFLGEAPRSLPNMLDYTNHISKKSAYNTPPVFSIYVSMLTMRWIKEHGGLSAMKVRNELKSELIYKEIDRNPLFYGTTNKEDRSVMSPTFRLFNEDLNADFLTICEQNGCVGVKGHRSVGGFRASIYNAMELEGVKLFVNLMQSFEAKKG